MVQHTGTHVLLLVIALPAILAQQEVASAWTETEYPWAAGTLGDGLDMQFIKDMENAPSGVNLIFYGDSILQCLRFEQGSCGGAVETGEKRFGKYNYFVAAVGNENTQRVMGRLLDGVIPEPTADNVTAAVLLLGHNDVAGGNADIVADRLTDIIYYLLDSDPGMQVVPLAMTPSTGSDMLVNNSQTYAPARELAARIDDMAADNPRVHFLDCTSHFVNSDDAGVSNVTLIPDGQHLSAAGFDALADCLEPTLDRVLAPVVLRNEGKEGKLLNVITGPPPS